jgi:hypothetical protein
MNCVGLKMQHKACAGLGTITECRTDGIVEVRLVVSNCGLILLVLAFCECRWDRGGKNHYRMGAEGGKFDLEVVTSTQV